MHIGVHLVYQMTEEQKMKYIAKTEREAQKFVGILKEAGYKRTSNCFWFEIWTKDNREDVTIERDFD